MVYELLYYMVGNYNLISPTYYLLKYGWYYYKLKAKSKTVVIEQKYDKEEDYVHLEITEIPI
jgi:hypothetical protein